MINFLAIIFVFVNCSGAHHYQDDSDIDSDVDIYEARSRVFIKSSKEKPQDVFLAVSYRNYWFYIEDTDFRSKRIFSFLLFLLSLAEGGSQGVAPVLTLPAG
jgi:hypothetical protein